MAVVDFLKSKCFPPTHECKLVKNQLSKVCAQGQRESMTDGTGIRAVGRGKGLVQVREVSSIGCLLYALGGLPSKAC